MEKLSGNTFFLLLSFLRNILARELGNPIVTTTDTGGQPVSTSILDILVGSNFLAFISYLLELHDTFESVKSEAYELYIQLIPDYTFKKILIACLVKHYEKLVFVSIYLFPPQAICTALLIIHVVRVVSHGNIFD